MTLSNGVKKQKKGAKGEKERGREDVNGVLETKKLVEWSIDEVGLFLCSISLPQYKDVFYFNEVDGEMLSTVDEEDLLVLPIERMGHRKKILRFDYLFCFIFLFPFISPSPPNNRKVQNYLGESPSDEDLSESITTETPTLTTTTTTNIIVDDPPNSPTSNDLVSNSPSLSTFGYSIQDEVMFKCDILTLEETAR